MEFGGNTEGEMDEACSIIHRRDEKCIQNFSQIVWREEIT
jgi:hypothetical protein